MAWPSLIISGGCVAMTTWSFLHLMSTARDAERRFLEIQAECRKAARAAEAQRVERLTADVTLAGNYLETRPGHNSMLRCNLRQPSN